jgi:hypothetical protein
VFVFTSHLSPLTSQLAYAELSKGKSRKLDAAATSQSGPAISTANRRSQSSIATSFAEGHVRTSRVNLRSGFLATVVGSASRVLVLPLSELDLVTLIAKTDPFGEPIPAQTWQKDSTPVFIWEPPAEGVDLAGYSYALDAEPDDTVDTTATSWDVAQDAIARLTDGSHTFAVQAVNSAGQTGRPVKFEIWLDITAPTLGSYSPSPGILLNSLSPQITIQATELHSGIDPAEVIVSVNGSRASVAVDQGGLLSASGAGKVREGSNRVEVQVPDRLGNVLAPLVWSFSVDVTPPSGALIINAGAALTTSVHVSLNVTAADTLSGVTRMLISNDPQAGYVDEPFNAVRALWRLNAVRGPQTVYVKLVDGVGNVSAPISDEIELGLLSPDTLIVSGPAGVTPELKAKFTFSCPEGSCVFSFAFDHDDWSDWAEASPAELASLAMGNHYFKVKAAKEINGEPGIQPDEEDPTPAERTWIVGAELPSSIFIPRGSPIKLWRLE